MMSDKVTVVIGMVILAWLIFSSPDLEPFESCLRDWPLAECQARKDAGAL